MHEPHLRAEGALAGDRSLDSEFAFANSTLGMNGLDSELAIAEPTPAMNGLDSELAIAEPTPAMNGSLQLAVGRSYEGGGVE